MKKTLLQIAKDTKFNRPATPITDDEIELAIAWARGEITYKQARVALKGPKSTMTAYVRLALCLREYIRRNQL